MNTAMLLWIGVHINAFVTIHAFPHINMPAYTRMNCKGLRRNKTPCAYVAEAMPSFPKEPCETLDKAFLGGIQNCSQLLQQKYFSVVANGGKLLK